MISLQGATATRISITDLMWTFALIMHNNLKEKYASQGRQFNSF